MNSNPDDAIFTSSPVKTNPLKKLKTAFMNANLAVKLLSVPLLAIVLLLTGYGVKSVLFSNVAATSVGQYQLWEDVLPYSGNYSNPNDPQQADLEAVFTAPSGSQIKVPGFFYQDFTRSGGPNKETLTPVANSSSWRVRYAPSQLGTYKYSITLHDAAGTNTLATGSFTSVASSNPGYVRANGLHLQFDNGKTFVPIGINAPWFQTASGHQGHSWGDGTYGIDTMDKMMVQNGINYYHFWTCATFAAINIGCDPVNDLSTTNMDQASSWRIDYAVNQAQSDGIYLMPILKHKDQKNFTYADQVKERYFVARWGWSPAIMGWDWNKEGATNATADSQWASYTKSVDPYVHLTSTSEWNHYPTLGKNELATYNSIFSDPNMTLVQTHDYTVGCNDTVGVDPSMSLFLIKTNPSDPRYYANFKKPSFIGETGVSQPDPSISCTNTGTAGGGGGNNALYAVDNTGLIVKSEAWGAYLTTAGGLSPWQFSFDPSCALTSMAKCAWSQLNGLAGLSKFVKAAPAIPDQAVPFTDYNDTTQVSTSSGNVRIIGRKDSTFVVGYLTNTTALPLDILSGKTSTPITNATVTLKNMSNAPYSVSWYDTYTGGLLKSETDTAAGGNLTVALPVALDKVNFALVVSQNTSQGTPSVTLSANPAQIQKNGTSTLTWSSANVTSCTASGGWTGSKPLSGSSSTGQLSVNTTYTLSCSGNQGAISTSATVVIGNSVSTPSVTLSANPAQIQKNGTSTLTWSSANVTSCTASGGWTGSKPLSGSSSTGQLSVNTTYTLSCSGNQGNATATAAVTINTPVDKHITLDNVSHADATDTLASSVTWKHTIGGGDNRLLLVSVPLSEAPDHSYSVSSVTYNGTNLKRISSLSSPSSGCYCDNDLWYLAAGLPKAGTYPVTIKIDGGQQVLTGAASTFENVSQANPFASPVLSKGYVSPSSRLSLSVPSSSNQLVVDNWVTDGSRNYNAADGQTVLWILSNHRSSFSSTKPGGADVDSNVKVSHMSWNSSDAFNYADIGLALNPSNP